MIVGVLDLFVQIFVQTVEGGDHVGDRDDSGVREQESGVGEDLQDEWWGNRERNKWRDIPTTPEKVIGCVQRPAEEGEGWMDVDEDEVDMKVSDQVRSA